MKRLELSGIRVCERCGRGVAELQGPDGESLVVKLDAVRARQLSGTADGAEMRSLIDAVLAELGAAGVVVSEIVFDASEGRLGALVTLLRGDDAEIVACTAEEGVAVAVRAQVKIYATDEALSHAAARPGKPATARGAGGPDTIH